MVMVISLFLSLYLYILGGPKNGTIFVHLIILPNINRFSKFFTVRIRRQFVIRHHHRSHRTSRVSLHYLVKCHCLKKNNNKTTSATTHFKKLTTETTCLLSQLLSRKSHLKVFPSNV